MTSDFPQALDRLSTAAENVIDIFAARVLPACQQFIAAVEKLTTAPKLSYRQLQRLTPAERTEYARKRGRARGGP